MVNKDEKTYCIICSFDNNTYIHTYIYIYIHIYIFIYIYIYNVYILEHKHTAQNNENRAQSLKWLLETLFLAIKEVHWLHHKCYIVEHKVCSVTSEPTQSSSRCVSSLKNSSVLLTTEWSPSNH